MEETDHAIQAINALHGMDINGRKLDVKIASPKGNRPPKKEAELKKNPAFKKPFNKELRGPGQNATRGGVQWRGGHQGGGAYDKPNKNQ